MKIIQVQLGGQMRPMKFGFIAISEFSEMTNRKLGDITDLTKGDLTVKEMLLLCYCALKNGARVEGREFNFSVEDVGDWLDENPEVIVQMGAAISEQMPKTNFKKRFGKK